MTRAHATHKGAVGVELGDEKGSKEMIDAPMLKQVGDNQWIYVFIHLPEYPCSRQRRLSK
jgi:hypothetical protein